MRYNKKLSAVDLFAGAGGFSLAAIKAGINIKFAIENDAHSVATYRNNIGQIAGNKRVKVYAQDILSYDPQVLLESHYVDQQCDLVLGGPPCQGVSTHRISNAGVDDPRNELIMAYFKFVRVLKPTMFLMENVPGILWPRHQGYLKRFYKEGRASGFNV